jgi:hypothetical protein
LHDALHELRAQLSRLSVGASFEQAPPFAHWTHDESLAHAVTSAQQLCARQASHALLRSRYWSQLPPDGIPMLGFVHCELQELLTQLARSDEVPSFGPGPPLSHWVHDESLTHAET